MKKLLILFLSFCFIINTAYAETLDLNQDKNKINYIFSYLNVPVKKKFLPANGHINLIKGDDNSLFLKGLDLDVKFTSKSKVFKKVIDYDKYPNFKFWTELENPIKLSNEEYIDLEGYLSFHGVTQKISIKLKNEMTKEGTSLTGFFNIKMTDFGLIPPRVFFIVLDDVIKSKVEIYSP